MGLFLISSVTASADATVEFTTGIDATYNEYQFHFVNMHPATGGVRVQFGVNAAGQTGFNEVITSTFFKANHHESNGYAGMGYATSQDLAQAATYQNITDATGNDNDNSASGVLTLYDPSSTTYVKHFIARGSDVGNTPSSEDVYAAGYINTTAAIDEISFRFHSGNIDAGTIHMYGVG